MRKVKNPITTAERQQYSQLRRTALKEQRALSSMGLGTKATLAKSFPTLRELSKGGQAAAAKAIRSAIKKTETFTQRHAVPVEMAKAEAKKAAHRAAQQRYSQKSTKQAEARKRYAEKQKALSKEQKSLRKSIKTLSEKGLIPKTKKFGPDQLKELDEYLKYRYAQGVDKKTYFIDKWVEDYETLKNKGYSYEDIVRDVEAFKAHREQMVSRADSMATDPKAYSMSDINENFMDIVGRKWE